MHTSKEILYSPFEGSPWRLDFIWGIPFIRVFVESIMFHWPGYSEAESSAFSNFSIHKSNFFFFFVSRKDTDTRYSSVLHFGKVEVVKVHLTSVSAPTSTYRYIIGLLLFVFHHHHHHLTRPSRSSEPDLIHSNSLETFYSFTLFPWLSSEERTKQKEGFTEIKKKQWVHWENTTKFNNNK